MYFESLLVYKICKFFIFKYKIFNLWIESWVVENFVYVMQKFRNLIASWLMIPESLAYELKFCLFCLKAWYM